MNKKRKNKKHHVYIVIGSLLIIGTLKGNLKYISDWTDPEIIGINVFSIIALIVGSVFLYKGIKNNY